MGMASILFEAKTSVVESTPFIYQEWNLETPHYKLQWNKSGQLTSIFDKDTSREVLADGEIGNELQVFEDKPKSRHEAWDIDIFYQDKQRSITGCSGITLAENGPIRASIRFQWSYMDSTIVQDMVVYADSRRIDFVTKVDWHEQRQLLKAAFPVSIRSTEATYDIQFGNVKRPTHWNTSWDAARFETVGHQWADLSERDYGVSLLNDCKYGYDIKGHVLRLSLIKSAMVPDREADQGEHMFTYSLFPHQGDWHSGGTVREAWALNQPLSICSGVSASGHTSLFDFSLSHVMVDAVKPAENGDGFILRIHEYAGARGQLTIHCSLPIREWLETDLLERPISDGTGKGDIQSNIKPYEIKTFLIRF
jgi:alpha-mannosidase